MPAAPLAVDPCAPVLARDGRFLILPLGRPHAVLSWAIVNGGRRRATEVVWRGVRKGELALEVDAVDFLESSLAAVGLPDAVGLLTACDLSTFESLERAEGGWSAHCVTTLGMSNAVSAGDPPGPLRSWAGTINTVCRLSHPLTEAALIEAIALAAEARTAAVMEAQVPSERSARCATGTGTDCIVVAAPEGPEPQPYVGKHTALGAVLGAAVRETTARGIERWLRSKERL